MTPQSKARKVVTYLRVSTTRQGESGLGIEAQRNAVEDFLNGNGWELVAECVEVESGRKNERPELQRALKLAKLHRAMLVVSRLDRLSRNAAFLLSLMEAGVEVRFADMPSADDLVIRIMASLAQWEAEQISKRTRAALAAAKARGTKLGRPENLKHGELGRQRSAEVRRARADGWAQDLEETVRSLQAEGATSLHAIANGLMAAGLPTPMGEYIWSRAQVSRLLKRLG